MKLGLYTFVDIELYLPSTCPIVRSSCKAFSLCGDSINLYKTQSSVNNRILDKML